MAHAECGSFMLEHGSFICVTCEVNWMDNAHVYQDRGKNRTKQSGKAGGGSRGGKLRHSRDLYITRMDESRSCVTKRGKARERRGEQTCETLD